MDRPGLSSFLQTKNAPIGTSLLHHSFYMKLLKLAKLSTPLFFVVLAMAAVSPSSVHAASGNFYVTSGGQLTLNFAAPFDKNSSTGNPSMIQSYHTTYPGTSPTFPAFFASSCSNGGCGSQPFYNSILYDGGDPDYGTFLDDDSYTLNLNVLIPSATSGDYWIKIDAPNSNGGAIFEEFYNIHFDGSSWSGGTPVNTNTRIDTVEPYDGEVVSTSTPTAIGATGYIATSDYKDGARLRIKLNNNTDNQTVGALAGFTQAFGNWNTFPLDSSGSFTFSTTSITNGLGGADRVGRWDMRTIIQIPSISIFGFNLTYKDVAATSTSYVYGELTGVDEIQNHAENVLGSIVASGDPFQYCQFNFASVIDLSADDNILTCVLGLVSSLIVPNSASIQALFDTTQNEFLTKPPFAYPYLAITALTGYSGVASTSLTSSNLSITFPNTGGFASSSAGSIAGETITFIDWDALANSVDSAPVHAGMDDLYDFITLMMSVAFIFWCWNFGKSLV